MKVANTVSNISMKMIFKISANQVSMYSEGITETGFYKGRMSCYSDNKYCHSRCFNIPYYILSLADMGPSAYSRSRIGCYFSL